MTHRGVIANMMQGRVFEDAAERTTQSEVALGILPLTHSYGLITQHAMLWRGDTLVIHPRFDMQSMLKSIMQFKINRLYLVSGAALSLSMGRIYASLRNDQENNRTSRFRLFSLPS